MKMRIRIRRFRNSDFELRISECEMLSPARERGGQGFVKKWKVLMADKEGFCLDIGTPAGPEDGLPGGNRLAEWLDR